MKKLSNLSYFLTTSVFFVLIDFYFSNLIVERIKSGQAYSNDFVNFIYVKNTGAAFSILENSTGILIAISVAALAFMAYYILRNLEELKMKEIFCISILMSGIYGNLYERIVLGYVRDFFELRFINFPVFNISDVFINIGVFAIIILILLTKKPIKLL